MPRPAPAAGGRGGSRIFTGKEALATEFIKEHSRKVTDVMTHDVVTASPDTPLWTIANLLEKNAIKRVPIVKEDKIVGIVSRANLLQALASQGKQVEGASPADDAKRFAKQCSRSSRQSRGLGRR